MNDLNILAIGALIPFLYPAALVITGKLSRKRFPVLYFIVPTFISLVLINGPIALYKYADCYEPNTGSIFFFVFLQSVQYSLRSFAMGGEWSEVYRTINETVPGGYAFMGFFLNICAPFLTIAAVVNLIIDKFARFRVRLISKSSKDLIFMSEMNESSITLAKNIIEEHNGKAKIVFTNAYPLNGETDDELAEKARGIGAVLLRTDISELEVRKRKGKTDFFLIGHNEEENVMHAEKLFMRNRDSQNTSIYIQSVSDGNAAVIDSLCSFLNSEDNPYTDMVKKMSYRELRDAIENGKLLRIRRFDPDHVIAWSAVPQMGFIRRAIESGVKDNDSRLSVTIVACTRLGFVIFKTLLWYCQSDKFKLELNVVYSDDTGGENIRKKIERKCPEIVSTNAAETEGDAYYDIRFISFDEYTSLASNRFHNSSAEADETVKRLKKTNAVIVDMGRDDRSIEMAIEARTAFERAGIMPEIYAACSDNENILSGSNNNGRLVTYRDEDYRIKFFGKIRDVYTYDNFLKDEVEKTAFLQHVKWVDVENYSDSDEKLKNELLKYERHEYFRTASITKAIYLKNVLADPGKELNKEECIRSLAQNGLSKEDLNGNALFEYKLSFRNEYECRENPKTPKDRWDCVCENCMKRRKLEHRRWNAFMRAEGFITSKDHLPDDKRPLAKIHGNIIPFGELRDSDRKKDS